MAVKAKTVLEVEIIAKVAVAVVVSVSTPIPTVLATQ